MASTLDTGEQTMKSPEEFVRLVQKITKDELDGMIKDLKTFYPLGEDDAKELAEGILLRDEKLRPNSKDTDKLEKINSHKKKMPTFLIVIAPKISSPFYQKQEVDQRENEAKEFMDTFKVDFITPPWKSVVVCDYDEMKANVENFIREKNESDMPIVVFLGHGATDDDNKGAKLCFSNNVLVDAIEVLQLLFNCHQENRTKEMPKHQMRVVFSQCFAHCMDRDVKTGEIQFKYIEYLYLTSPALPETMSSLKLCPPSLSKLERFHCPCDVHLPGKKRFLEISYPSAALGHPGVGPDVFSRFQKPSSKTPWLKECVDSKDKMYSCISKFLNEKKAVIPVILVRGPGNLEPIIEAAPLDRRVENMRLGPMIQSMSLESTTEAEPLKSTAEGEQLESTAEGEQLEPTTEGEQLESTAEGEQLESTVEGEQFRPGAEAKQVNSTTEILKLQLGNEEVPANEIFQGFVNTKELRIVFCCHDISQGKIWFSNAIPPAVEYARNWTLNSCYMDTIKDGPVNQNIQCEKRKPDK